MLLNKGVKLDEIKAWLSLNYGNVKSVSFLLHNEHGFSQAPFEEIDEATYTKMIALVEPINSLSALEMDDIDIADCETGACPVR